MPTGLVLILFPGCGFFSSGSYLDSEQACEYNPHAWWGTLTRYVDQGNGEGGFNLEPPAEQYLARIQGFYDLDNGDLGFSREYTDTHYMVQEIGTGYGIVDRNGDLDIIYKFEHNDMLAESWTTEIHEVRVGCYGTVTELYSDVQGDESTVEYRFVSDDEVIVHVAIAVGDGEEITNGSDYADGTGDRLREYESDDYGYTWDTQLLASGGYSSDWSQYDDDRERDHEGLDVGKADGSRTRDYTIFDQADGSEVAVYHGERGYDGSGAGTFTYPNGESCDLEFGDWYTCEYTCTDGGSGNC